LCIACQAALDTMLLCLSNMPAPQAIDSVISAIITSYC
jgi:hypothetical protein